MLTIGNGKSKEERGMCTDSHGLTLKVTDMHGQARGNSEELIVKSVKKRHRVTKAQRHRGTEWGMCEEKGLTDFRRKI